MFALQRFHLTPTLVYIVCRYHQDPTIKNHLRAVRPCHVVYTGVVQDLMQWQGIAQAWDILENLRTKQCVATTDWSRNELHSGLLRNIIVLLVPSINKMMMMMMMRHLCKSDIYWPHRNEWSEHDLRKVTCIFLMECCSWWILAICLFRTNLTPTPSL